MAKTLRAALLAATAFCAAGSAGAQSSEQMDARMRQLESNLMAMQAELAELRAREAARAPERLPAAPAPAAAPPEGMRVGATTIKLGGFVKAETLVTDYADGDVGTGASARDFYHPASTPVGGRSEDPEVDFHAKQTRLTLTATRPVEGGKSVTAYVEADFQASPGTGTEIATNAYNFAVRRATISYGAWLFGQDWTTFQNTAVLPETTDLIGITDGTVFVRQPQIRYTHALGPKTQLQVAIENPETTFTARTSTTITGADDDQLPDLVARVNHTIGKNQFALAGVVRRLSVEEAGVSREDMGWGISFSGKIAVGEKDDIRFMLTGGEGISRYVGLGFRGDAALEGLNGLSPVGVIAGNVSYKHYWTAKTRSTIMYAFQDYDQEAALTSPTASDSSQSVAVNIFHTPTPGLDVGLEFRHAMRELFNGADGSLSRLHFIARQSF
jgi:hypothetical protein